MTELTQEQLDTLKRVKVREGKTTPTPWAEVYQAQYADRNVIRFQGISGIVNWDLPKNNNMFIYWHDDGIFFENEHDGLLVLDAPNTEDLCLAQARIIEDQARRIAALEAVRNAEYQALHTVWLDQGDDETKPSVTIRRGNHHIVAYLGDFEDTYTALVAGEAYINNLVAPEVKW